MCRRRFGALRSSVQMDDGGEIGLETEKSRDLFKGRFALAATSSESEAHVAQPQPQQQHTCARRIGEESSCWTMERVNLICCCIAIQYWSHVLHSDKLPSSS